MKRITRGCIDAIEWSKEENDILLNLIGTSTYPSIKKQLPGRSLEAIKRQALRLGHPLYQGTVTLNQIIRETGYNWKQLERAKEALNQHWMRATGRGRSRFLIKGEQLIELIEYLKREPYPFTSRFGSPRLTWSRYHKICLGCSSTNRPHYGHGYCEACWKRKTRAAKKNGRVAQLGERLVCTQEVAGSMPVTSTIRGVLGADP